MLPRGTGEQVFAVPPLTAADDEEHAVRLVTGRPSCAHDATRPVAARSSNDIALYTFISACDQANERGPSNTLLLTSSPRCAGRSCMNRASGHRAISSGRTRN